VIHILTQASKAGDVFIVTNGWKSWVHFCAKTFLPKTLKFLKEHDTKLISARDLYEKSIPDVKKWKIQALKEQVIKQIN
jgi:hypothetical protein